MENEKDIREKSLLDKVLEAELMKKGTGNIIIVSLFALVIFNRVANLNLGVSILLAFVTAILLAYFNDWL